MLSGHLDAIIKQMAPADAKIDFRIIHSNPAISACMRAPSRGVFLVGLDTNIYFNVSLTWPRIGRFFESKQMQQNWGPQGGKNQSVCLKNQRQALRTDGFVCSGRDITYVDPPQSLQITITVVRWRLRKVSPGI